LSLEAAKKAVEYLENNIFDDDLGNPHFGATGVTTFPLTSKDFRPISERSSKRRLVFVDGGNQEVLGAPNFSIQLNRVYSCAWNGRNRVEWKLPRVEFFSSTYSCFKNNEIHYESSVMASSGESMDYLPDAPDLCFSSMERSLMNGNQRAGIERVGSVARRFAEWRLALKAIHDLSVGDVIVMDGTLQSNFKNEGKYAKALTSAAKARGIILIGLSKTSTLFTTTGLSLLGAVNKLAEDGQIKGNWYYPVAESHSIDHDVVISVARLNPIADRVFRVELQREEYEKLGRSGVEEIFSLLCQNSCDASFPGYPYGLIDADRFARVSYDEIEYYRGLIISHISKMGNGSKFLSHIHSGDAHNLLNLLVK
jgi:NurA domain